VTGQFNRSLICQFIIFLFGVSFFLLLFPILYFNTIKIIIEIIFILSGKVPTFVTFLAAFFSYILELIIIIQNLLKKDKYTQIKKKK